MKLTSLRSWSGSIAALSLFCVSTLHAGDAGHFVGGVLNIRDYFVPDPGLYGALYNYYYTSDRFSDQNGNKVNSVTLNPGPGRGLTANIDVNLDMYVLAPALIWVSPWKILGAKYGAYISPTFANASVDGAISTIRGRGGNASTSTFAPGDLYVQPLWLGWTFSHWDFAFGYGFYAPVGKFNTETVNLPNGSVTLPSTDSIGLGFWTQQFQGAAAWYPWTNKATAITAVLTYDYNSEQQGTGVTPGQNLWLNWGISQYLPLTKDQKLLLEVGPAAYYEWQVSNSSDSDSRTQVSGIGGQIGITYVPWDFVLNFRGFYEYHAENRVQGASFGINLVKKF